MPELSVTKQPSGRVECVGPHGENPLIVSMVTATREGWKGIQATESSKYGERRQALGWCRACADRFGVEDA